MNNGTETSFKWWAAETWIATSRVDSRRPALGTHLAAAAAWKSASTSARASRHSEQAALAAMLGVIPVPHPRVSLNGTAGIKNRGTTEALNLNWRIVHQDDEDQVVEKGSLNKVLPAQSSRSALDPPSADLAQSLKVRRCYIFICEYQAVGASPSQSGACFVEQVPGSESTPTSPSSTPVAGLCASRPSKGHGVHRKSTSGWETMRRGGNQQVPNLQQLQGILVVANEPRHSGHP